MTNCIVCHKDLPTERDERWYLTSGPITTAWFDPDNPPTMRDFMDLKGVMVRNFGPLCIECEHRIVRDFSFWAPRLHF
jgi:hypothetical protein